MKKILFLPAPVALLGGAYLAYHFLFKKDTERTSGTVTLKANVPYGFDLVQAFTKPAGTPSDLRAMPAQQTLTKSLVTQGAQNVTYSSASDGVHVHFLWTHPAAVNVDIGKLAYGGAVVHAITRLDGKAWDA